MVFYKVGMLVGAFFAILLMDEIYVSGLKRLSMRQDAGSQSFYYYRLERTQDTFTTTYMERRKSDFCAVESDLQMRKEIR